MSFLSLDFQWVEANRKRLRDPQIPARMHVIWNRQIVDRPQDHLFLFFQILFDTFNKNDNNKSILISEI